MRKSLYLNRMSKEHKLYILLAVAMPFAIAAVVWAWTVDSLFVAAYYCFLLAFWVVYVLVTARKLPKRREADETDAKNTAPTADSPEGE